MVLKLVIPAIIGTFFILFGAFYNKIFKQKEYTETTGSIIKKYVDNKYTFYDVKFNINNKSVVCQSHYYISSPDTMTLASNIKISYTKNKNNKYKIKILEPGYNELNVDKMIQNICMVLGIGFWIVVFGMLITYFVTIK